MEPSTPDIAPSMYDEQRYDNYRRYNESIEYLAENEGLDYSNRLPSSAQRDTTASDEANRLLKQAGSRRGEKNGQSKLDDKTVLEIRHLSAAGVKGKILAQMFGVSNGLISQIINRKKWMHI